MIIRSLRSIVHYLDTFCLDGHRRSHGLAQQAGAQAKLTVTRVSAMAAASSAGGGPRLVLVRLDNDSRHELVAPCDFGRGKPDDELALIPASRTRVSRAAGSVSCERRVLVVRATAAAPLCVVRDGLLHQIWQSDDARPFELKHGDSLVAEGGSLIKALGAARGAVVPVGGATLSIYCAFQVEIEPAAELEPAVAAAAATAAGRRGSSLEHLIVPGGEDDMAKAIRLSVTDQEDDKLPSAKRHKPDSGAGPEPAVAPAAAAAAAAAVAPAAPAAAAAAAPLSGLGALDLEIARLGTVTETLGHQHTELTEKLTACAEQQALVATDLAAKCERRTRLASYLQLPVDRILNSSSRLGQLIEVLPLGGDAHRFDGADWMPSEAPLLAVQAARLRLAFGSVLHPRLGSDAVSIQATCHLLVTYGSILTECL